MGNIFKSPLNMAHSLPLLSPKPGLHLHNPIRTQRGHLLLTYTLTPAPEQWLWNWRWPVSGPTSPHLHISGQASCHSHKPCSSCSQHPLQLIPSSLLSHPCSLPVQQPWTGTLHIFSPLSPSSHFTLSTLVHCTLQNLGSTGVQKGERNSPFVLIIYYLNSY